MGHPLPPRTLPLHAMNLPGFPTNTVGTRSNRGKARRYIGASTTEERVELGRRRVAGEWCESVQSIVMAIVRGAEEAVRLPWLFAALALQAAGRLRAGSADYGGNYGAGYGGVCALGIPSGREVSHSSVVARMGHAERRQWQISGLRSVLPHSVRKPRLARALGQRQRLALLAARGDVPLAIGRRDAARNWPQHGG